MSNDQVDVIQEILVSKLKEQPWYKTYINTAITVLALGINVIWVLISLGVNIDPTILATVAAFIQAAGAVGVKFAANGVTPRQIKDIEDYVGRHRITE